MHYAVLKLSLRQILMRFRDVVQVLAVSESVCIFKWGTEHTAISQADPTDLQGSWSEPALPATCTCEPLARSRAQWQVRAGAAAEKQLLQARLPPGCSAKNTCAASVQQKRTADSRKQHARRCPTSTWSSLNPFNRKRRHAHILFSLSACYRSAWFMVSLRLR